MKYLTRKEEMILLAILRLEDCASLVKIREHLKTSTGHEWTVGNVYVPLDRMRKLGYLESHIGDPTAQRGGKAVKFYHLSKKGKEALTELRKVHDRMWTGIPEFAKKK
ncbi:MAG: PadR family transcriptional regulator [Candidatus Aminicenantes bacterium]|nr:MAG: PadR family transcriptional regulator [Candidatus Aminicenantes bacterium]